ncbi:replication initiator protein A [Paracoccus sp. SCSIO 75233]|uniref:replication initiator protein A n=1 Tax=Paracoccus sp. SCSIO 75233 TaxID=3017782 RepID=UPI0022F0A693|nr:replication initiator protein A [Paracoccus sp. SCSIO 75233]WBU55370.1 replication initiator protein A [Paracoccus sp. SCSIO 75233]
MDTENTNSSALPALLPERHPQHDLFICDVSDAVLKDVMQHLEHPFYSLSKKPETRVKRYRNGEHWLEVTPSVKGLATIYDKDILIYAISQIMSKLKRGETVSPRIRLNPHELLIFANRGTSGREYQALLDALDRLEGTRIRTNIVTGDEEQLDGFGLIDASSIRRKHGLDGRLLWCEIKLSDWVFNAIRNEEVLTLHRDYFRLRKPLERRVYEIARKHCGHQKNWRISLAKLLLKTGSQSPPKRFRQMIRQLVEHDHLPDYHVTYEEEGDIVGFTRRCSMAPVATAETQVPALKPGTHDRAREVAPGWDVYQLEQEWRDWIVEAPQNADAAFIGFCKKWYERRGRG